MTDGSFRTALTIAGTDPTGGAGIGADIRTFSDHSVLPLAVITSVNAQNTGAFLHAELVDAARVTDQLRAVFDDVPVDAIKIGMLGTARQATAVATFLRALAQRPPIVVDPVLRSTSGAPLIDAAGVDILRAEILDMATVITPNRSEADRLALEEDPARWAASHPAAVLITGGDDGGAEVTDQLFHDGALTHYRAPRLDDGPGVRGTGCALSSAIAARLAHGASIEEAIRLAITYVRGRIASAVDLGAHRRVMVSAR